MLNKIKFNSLLRAVKSGRHAQTSVFLQGNVYGTGGTPMCIQIRGKRGDSSHKDTNLSTLFTPVQVKPNPDDINVGAELTGNLNKADLLKVLNRFYQNPAIKQLLTENGLDSKYQFGNMLYVDVGHFNA